MLAHRLADARCARWRRHQVAMEAERSGCRAARSRGPACRGRGCPERFREQSRVEGAPLAHTGTAGLGAGLPGPGQPQRSPRSPLEPPKLAALPAPSPVTPPGSPSSPGCSPPQAPWPPQHDRPARPRPRCLSSRSHSQQTLSQEPPCGRGPSIRKAPRCLGHLVSAAELQLACDPQPLSHTGPRAADLGKAGSGVTPL